MTVGPFAHVRGGGPHRVAASELGNFAEVKNSRIGARSKSHHFSYLGDAEVGSRREHRRRHDHRQLRRPAQAPHDDRRRRVHRLRHDPARAGRRSAKAAYTGAGSVVTRDVPPGKMAVGVPARIRRPVTSKREPATEPAPTMPAVEGELVD